MPFSRRIVLGRCALAVWPALTASALAALPSSSFPTPLLTLLDGDAVLLRGEDRLALAEGVALQQDDILEVPAASRLARIEFSDGPTVALGPGSRVLLGPRLVGPRSGASLYLLAGSAKFSLPAGQAAGIASPAFDASTSGGTLVLSVLPTATRLFVESGTAAIRRRGADAQSLRSGEFLSLASVDGVRPELSMRPAADFLSTLPRAFMDTLPSRAATFRNHRVTPRRLGSLTYADAQPWLDAEAELRRANLPRWRALARDPAFRRELAVGLKAHPEWGPVLSPPPPSPRASAARVSSKPVP